MHHGKKATGGHYSTFTLDTQTVDSGDCNGNSAGGNGELLWLPVSWFVCWTWMHNCRGSHIDQPPCSPTVLFLLALGVVSQAKTIPGLPPAAAVNKSGAAGNANGKNSTAAKVTATAAATVTSSTSVPQLRQVQVWRSVNDSKISVINESQALGAQDSVSTYISIQIVWRILSVLFFYFSLSSLPFSLFL